MLTLRIARLDYGLPSVFYYSNFVGAPNLTFFDRTETAMKVAPLATIIGAYLLCTVTPSQQKELIWIQHPDVADFYEYLLDEREECKKANTSPTTELFKRVATIGKKSRKPPLSSSSGSPSPQSSDSESPTRTSPRSLFHRSNSSSCRTTVLKTNRKVLQRVQTLNQSQSAEYGKQNSAATAQVYRLLRTSSTLTPRKMSARSRYRAFPFLTQNMCPFHRKSFIKMMDTADKQELCDADLTLFAFLDESYAFPASEADAGDGQTRGLRSSARSILHRKTFGLQQHFIENIPKKKQKKKKNHFFGPKTKREVAVERLHSSSERTKNYVKIFVKTREDAVRVKAVPCIVHGNFSWFLVDGYGTDQYFTVEKNSEETLYRVTGLLDAVATVEVDDNGNPVSPENLERSFRAMQDWIERSNSRIELCGLDNIQKFRLCSAAYAAWQQYFTESARKLNFSRTFKSEDCIKNVKLKSKFQEGTYVSMIPVMLVPCIVNNREPAFYITADERSGSVFIVSASHLKVGEVEERNYSLEILVRNINVLRNIQADDLVVTCKRHRNRNTQESSEEVIPIH